ncbi:MAG: hypothetical protein ACLFRY_11055 [Spirochaetia bacterium]
MDGQYRPGCWTCWWKTPGQCVFSDDMERVLPGMIAAELVVFSRDETAGAAEIAEETRNAVDCP